MKSIVITSYSIHYTKLYDALYIKKSELSFSINSKTNAIEDTNNSITEILNAQEELENSLSAYKNECENYKSTLSQISDQILDNNNKLNGYVKLLERKNIQLENSKNELSQVENKIRELTQKSKLLIDLENSMEGFAHSVKEIIKAGKSGRIGGIKGTVAQLINVESKYSLAIETALGGALQNIIVENEDVAKRCINLLKELNAGRATFLPKTSVKGNRLNENSLNSAEGYIAIASELVSFDNQYAGIINSLLGRIVIAENIELGVITSYSIHYTKLYEGNWWFMSFMWEKSSSEKIKKR